MYKLKLNYRSAVVQHLVVICALTKKENKAGYPKIETNGPSKFYFFLSIKIDKLLLYLHIIS